MSEPHWAETAKKRMKKLGVTQEDLKDVFDVTTRGAVGHYFTGRSIIDAAQLERLSEKLGVYLDYMPRNKNLDFSDDEKNIIPLSREVVKNAITDAIFTAIQLEAINLNGSAKISSIADLIADEIANANNISFTTESERREIS